MSWNPANFFVRRWQFTLIAFGLLVMLGLSALTSISRSEDPQLPFPVIAVTGILPGASPAEIEQLVSKPIEDVLNGLDDVKEVQSNSLDGAGLAAVEFNWSVDPDRKYDEVVREVNALRPTLPQGLTKLEVRKIGTNQVAFFQVALVSDILPMRRLEKLAHDLRDKINSVPGVKLAQYWGAPASQVQVSLDIAKLARLKLSPTAVSDALRNAGAEAPIGAIHAADRRFNVKTGGAFKTLESVGAVTVATPNGQVVRVRDVAKIAWGQEEAQHLTSFNGQRAMFVTATQKDGTDVTRISAGVLKVVDEFKQSLPAGVRLEPAFFQSKNVTNRLSHLYRDFAIALALVMVTLLPLGYRAGLVVMISIPLSLLMGLALLQAFGFNLNQLSIAGFILSLGLLVDDSIVVTENIARRMREGEDRITAAINGTGQIALAVIGCTGCLMLAFLPLMALPEGAGAYIRSLPVTVFCTVAASFVVSLTIIPFLASRLLPRHEAAEGNRLLQTVNHGIQTFYKPILHVALAKPWRALGLIMGICLLSFPMLKAIGSSLFPAAETPQFLVRIELPDGSPLTRTAQAMKFVEGRLAKTPEVVWFASNLGRGNPQIYYNQPQYETSPALAEIFVSLKDWKPGKSEAIVDDLRRQFAAYPGARINLMTFVNGPPLEAPIAVRIKGDDLNVLKALAGRVEAVLNQTPGTRDVVNPLRVDRTDLNLGIDEDKAAALGIPAGLARRVVRLALTGEDSARFRDQDGDDYSVSVRLPLSQTANGGRSDLSALDHIYIPSASGQATPLSAIASPHLQSSPSRIERYQRERKVTVTAYTQTGRVTAKVTEDALARIRAQVPLPPGYSLSLGGEAQAQSDSFSGLGSAIMVAILGILAVLVLEFGRFRSAIVVAGIIPLGLFGAVAALWVTGNSLSFFATIGIIALIGIEIKNSILLVDFTEQLHKEGVGLAEAIERAGEVRFLPVLLTSVTAIGGLLPLAFERSGLTSPLAIAIIGGLISSTLLSRIATPVMYWLVARGDEDKAKA
jgi:multidrug efflux pump subunit AcrB